MKKYFLDNSVYVHIPFCERKCFYCSFAVSVGQTHRAAEYVDALISEAKRYDPQEIRSLYFGGGTPSMLDDAQWEKLLTFMREHFMISEDCEITVEANPENIDVAKAAVLRDLGVGRVSLGIQTLNDQHLRALGRVHDSFKAMSAFNDLRRAGFQNINVDLMYSFPGQSDEEIRSDVLTVLALGSEHISIYTLTVEENSRFFARKIKEQDPEIQGRQYELVTDLLCSAGMAQYEVSNFSRPGFESRHNIHYWTMGDYIGLGMSSHSHRQGRRSWNTPKLTEYLERARSGAIPEVGHELLSPEQRLKEALVFGLRMNVGVDLISLEERFGVSRDEKIKRTLSHLVAAGLLLEENGRFRATRKGQLVLDELSVQLI